MVKKLHRLSPLLVGMLLAAAGLALMGAYTGLWGGWNTTSPYQVNSNDIIKSITFYADSLGLATQTSAVFQPQRAITFKSGSISTTSAFIGPNATDSADAQLYIRSGSLVFTLKMDSGASFQVTDPTDVTFPADVPCSLFLADDLPGGTDLNGTGGFDVNAVFWYTDN